MGLWFMLEFKTCLCWSRRQFDFIFFGEGVFEKNWITYLVLKIERKQWKKLYLRSSDNRMLKNSKYTSKAGRYQLLFPSLSYPINWKVENIFNSGERHDISRNAKLQPSWVFFKERIRVDWFFGFLFVFIRWDISFSCFPMSSDLPCLFHFCERIETTKLPSIASRTDRTCCIS